MGQQKAKVRSRGCREKVAGEGTCCSLDSKTSLGAGVGAGA